MKKLTVLLTICSLFVLTTIVFASNEKPGMNDDGVKWTPDKGDTYINDKSITRTGYTLDDNSIRDQVASVKIDAKAYIPCYLKLELTGNQGKTTAESFGPKAEATGVADGYFMLFDNEVGGFVDTDWKVKATGRNAEVAPGTGYNIAACDTFKVIVYSNDNFKYDVVAAPLVSKNNAKLDLIMGYKAKDAKKYTNVTFSDTTKDNTINIGTYAPCTTIEEYHKFAVPYTTTTVQGEYSGTVTFKATTI